MSDPWANLASNDKTGPLFEVVGGVAVDGPCTVDGAGAAASAARVADDGGVDAATAVAACASISSIVCGVVGPCDERILASHSHMGCFIEHIHVSTISDDSPQELCKTQVVKDRRPRGQAKGR